MIMVQIENRVKRNFVPSCFNQNKNATWKI